MTKRPEFHFEPYNGQLGVNKQQGIFVKDFWMSIFAVMPSVFYNNSLYVPNQTKLLTGYNYNVISPVNYYDIVTSYNTSETNQTYFIINYPVGF